MRGHVTRARHEPGTRSGTFQNHPSFMMSTDCETDYATE
jgi:hypothetical protein